MWAVTRSVILSYAVTSEASRKLEAFNPSIHQFIETEMCLCGCMKFGVHWIVNEKLNENKINFFFFFNPTKIKPVN